MEEGLTRTEKTPEVVVVTHDKGLAIDRRTSCQDNAVKDNIALGDIKFDSIHENVKVKKIMSNGNNVAIIESKSSVHENGIELLAAIKELSL